MEDRRASAPRQWGWSSGLYSAIRLPLGLWEAADGSALHGDADTIGEQIAQGSAQAIRRLAPPHPEIRAQLVISHMIGLAMARHVLAIEPIASVDAETLVAIVGPTLQRYVTGDLPVPRDRSERRR